MSSSLSIEVICFAFDFLKAIKHLPIVIVVNSFVLISNILKSSLHCPGYRIEKVPITINVLLTIGLRMKVALMLDLRTDFLLPCKLIA